MIVKAKRLVRPTARDLEIFGLINEAYESGLGYEFESVLRAAIDSRPGASKGSGVDLNETFYVLKLSELPDKEYCDIFRRLCVASPSMPLEVEIPQGGTVHGQLIERKDFQRIIKALIEVVLRLIGKEKAPSVGGDIRDGYEPN
ncbi:hypothetical protein AAER26_23425 [Pseudomonas aeruginosa]